MVYCTAATFFSEDEKKMVDAVFKNAIDSLSEDDRSLPQIEAILPVGLFWRSARMCTRFCPA